MYSPDPIRLTFFTPRQRNKKSSVAKQLLRRSFALHSPEFGWSAAECYAIELGLLCECQARKVSR